MGNVMSDEKDGQAENSGNGAKLVAGSDALSGRTRTAPVIEGQAIEISGRQPDAAQLEGAEAVDHVEAVPPEAQAASEAADVGPSEAGTQDSNPATEELQPKSGALRALGAAAAVLALGAGGYYGWAELGGKKALTDKISASTGTAQPGPAQEKAASTDKRAETPATALPSSGETTKKGDEVSTAAAPEKEAKATEPAPAGAPTEKTEAKPDPSGETTKKADEDAGPAPLEKQAAAPAQDKSAPADGAAKPAEAANAPAQVASESALKKDGARDKNADGADADKALARMAAQLAATQAALEQVSQRLKAVEGQLTAPKADARAPLAARDAGPANTGDASARVVVAQSLLAAVRQGDDYTPMLAALQNLGGDFGRLARLRAGLKAPAPAKLAEDFAALAPKIIASAAPAASQPTETKTPRGFGETAWTFLEVRLKKMVKIRPASAPDEDATAARIDRIEKDLARNDIAGALAERAQLPAPALSLTADWASAAQARLDAEEAAKAELAQALQNLSKSKS
jgi:hypothetical protein